MLDFLGDYDWWGGTLIFESRDFIDMKVRRVNLEQPCDS
jgi:hypothetical protein